MPEGAKLLLLKKNNSQRPVSPPLAWGVLILCWVPFGNPQSRSMGSSNEPGAFHDCYLALQIFTV